MRPDERLPHECPGESMTAAEIVVRAPGRVNLIGDHTDYTGGLVMPMAIDRATIIRARRAERVTFTSADEAEPVDLPLVVDDPAAVAPAWGRFVAGVVAELRPRHGARGVITTDVPIGAVLSTSAALEIAVALVLGFDGDALTLAQLCQRAENRASGVPTGIMDQLSIASGVRDHALLIDCGSLTVTPTALPDGIEVIVQFVAHRTLVGSAYGDRVAECAAAEREIGPLRTATLDAVRTISDEVVRRRAMHVVTENARVVEFAAALAAHDLAAAGAAMTASHASLRDLYSASTSVMDAAVVDIGAVPGVHGARMTGGGFGGCVVALADAGVAAGSDVLATAWVVRAADGACVIEG